MWFAFTARFNKIGMPNKKKIYEKFVSYTMFQFTALKID